MKRFLPYNNKLLDRAKEMRKNMTKTEQIIWFQYLQRQRFRVLRQRPIDNFIVDFYIPSKSIIIEKPKSLNDKLNLGLNIGLNDRLAFIKHLFNNSIDDYTRVLSQINSMSSFTEASSFIDKNVKADYNNWTDKNEYEERFMEIIEKRFN